MKLDLSLGLRSGRRAAFNFKSISGLVLDLDAAKGITLNGSTVSAWADQSASGFHVSQATPANQPTYNATDSLFNGRPSVQGSGSHYLTRAAVAAIFGATDYTVFAAIAWTSLTGAFQFFVSNLDANANGPEAGLSYTNARACNHSNVGTGTDGTPTASTAEVVQHQYTSAGGMLILKNNVSQTVATPAGNYGGAAASAHLAIMGRSAGTLGVNARITKIVAYNRGLTTAEATAVNRGIGALAGITVA